ncbi:MAG: MoxR-like ATPase in aerotolerance operon [Candidatus Jettenia ecosi]|uniref:MoxR-like ATPase in aerotolerance operon n=1 Tax=Candidatus Jettenia ecosi TaxID=2494326 RepID=A0A533QP79_9BACT|nr:MAG: MoxR-like ATPase in aerotolerance operon [Candidatus Jettenia ecosi]
MRGLDMKLRAKALSNRDSIREKIEKIKKEVGKVIVGQEEMVEGIIIALLSDGHILLEGYPGLGKTVTVKTVARVLDAKFQRVQFTPDLIPGDITGFEILDPETRKSRIQKGPVFTNLLLADEINRSPAKVQSALLEAMQEKQVTIGRETYPLEKLFLVLATQNPIEISGTYLLPEAEIDRFMFKLKVCYPSYANEREITQRQVLDTEATLDVILTPKEALSLRHTIAEWLPLQETSAIVKYITRLVRATRPEDNSELRELVMYGASPRATIALAKASRVYAFIYGDDAVLPEHVHKMAYPVLRHRIILSHEAESQDIDSDDIIEKILHRVARLE